MRKASISRRASLQIPKEQNKCKEDQKVEAGYPVSRVKTHVAKQRWKMTSISKESLGFATRATKSVSCVCAGGNPARDHLSNERTVLAYLRTSINLLLLGVTIIQFSKHTILRPVYLSLGENFSKVYGANSDVITHIKHTVATTTSFMTPLSSLAMTMAIVMATVGIVRYSRLQYLLKKGPDVFEETWVLMLFVVMILSSLTVACFVLIFKL